MVLLNLSSDTFVIYKKSMRICGIWPPDGLTTRTVIIYCAFVLFEITAVMTHNADLDGECIGSDHGTSKELTIVWTSILAILRLSFRLFGSQLTPLIESAIDDWSSMANSTERRIMRHHNKIGALPLFVVTVWAFVDTFIENIVVSLANAPATIDEKRKCDGNRSFAWGLARVIYVFIGNTLELVSYYSCVLLVWSLTMHLSGQYRILRRRFEELLSIEERSEMRARLRRLVDRHNHLIDLSAKLQDSVIVFVSIDLFAEQVLCCVLAFQLGHAIKDSDLMKMAEAIEYLTSFTVTIFFYYHMGDYLTECSEDVGDALIRNNWHDLSKESLINLSIVIARTRAPASLSAAKFHKLNHDNFKYVLNTMYSLVSLILAVTEEQK